MLPPGMIGSLIFDLTKKVRKDGTGLGITYHLLCAGLFALLALVIDGLMALFDTSGQGVAGKFFLWVFLAGIVIGSVYGIATWLIWFRKEK